MRVRLFAVFLCLLVLVLAGCQRAGEPGSGETVPPSPEISSPPSAPATEPTGTEAPAAPAPTNGPIRNAPPRAEAEAKAADAAPAVSEPLTVQESEAAAPEAAFDLEMIEKYLGSSFVSSPSRCRCSLATKQRGLLLLARLTRMGSALQAWLQTSR